MVTFTRRHYETIGTMLRQMTESDDGLTRTMGEDWLIYWDKMFQNDNPRYQREKFFTYVLDENKYYTKENINALAMR
jgi:hypothetical protein|tara:strand:- start:8 stop:238 length:231 start_codon:yes stop_codon:yes gene_type:complete